MYGKQRQLIGVNNTVPGNFLRDGDYLDMLVPYDEVQKNLQIRDATWLVPELHKVLKHQL